MKKTLRTSEVREVRASGPQPSKRNPLSVLATMTAVGGLFAVAAIPAYATQQTQVIEAKAPGTTQTIQVSDDIAASIATRDGYSATTPEQLAQASEDAVRAAANEAYLASGAREMGDDYPWPYEIMDNQLSPLNYYYRECVDFVAWRINRDQGSFAPPFKWVWSNLTPYGGNGGQWQYNWESLGRTISNVPIAGAVAYTGGNHVAYVKSVNADGTVTLEEYNYVPGMYSQRTIPASSVVSFLYPPS
ncbi:CHAP domain-containing protein [Antiquaquibacter oligotrophicus]|uniref:CHAP domain-containing protein n=1 Tax=Antiquaquibacter oligotrophicus TaxID=2880260 RepID=UPI002AC8B4F9|nr:CHAP domain-containing protein [Antiquaquibacter oligotrophicus]UDF14089.1 CHAP domain-containing protein [Antiquaquibacter oligotrophicus]